MHITHKIPSYRLQKSYLLGFMRGIGLSRYITRTAGIKGVKKYVLIVAYLVNDLRRVMVHIIKYTTKVKTDLIAACEMELYISSLMSLFFLWRKGYLRRKKL
jgi:hypothetical protein